MKIKYMLDNGAYKPLKAHETDGGFDLRTPRSVTVKAHESVAIDTGVHVQIPKGYCGLLVSKSGLNVDHDLTTTGLIDCGYTGSIVAKVHNSSDKDYDFEEGNKVTQLVILPIPKVELVQTCILEKTERGEKGFGSSGK